MGVTILLAILMHSAHSFQHFFEKFSEKKCHTTQLVHKYEFTNNHTNLEKCKTCEFSFSSSTLNFPKPIPFLKNVISTPNFFFNFEELSEIFKGSLFALRAPPSFIV